MKFYLDVSAFLHGYDGAPSVDLKAVHAHINSYASPFFNSFIPVMYANLIVAIMSPSTADTEAAIRIPSTASRALLSPYWAIRRLHLCL